jgi:hypothetical protein
VVLFAGRFATVAMCEVEVEVRDARRVRESISASGRD